MAVTEGGLRRDWNKGVHVCVCDASGAVCVCVCVMRVEPCVCVCVCVCDVRSISCFNMRQLNWRGNKDATKMQQKFNKICSF